MSTADNDRLESSELDILEPAGGAKLLYFEEGVPLSLQRRKLKSRGLARKDSER
jgi:hypothetical protein